MNIKNSLNFSSYKSQLQRASSFDHLPFYDNHFLSPYLLARHGFKMEKIKEREFEARCTNCNLSFKLDSLEKDVNAKEIQENFRGVIDRHEENCQFKNGKERQINKSDVIEFGCQLFEEILEQNLKSEKEVKVSDLEIFGSQEITMLSKISKSKKTSIDQIVLALFGFLIEEENVKCFYCGFDCKFYSPFSFEKKHRGFCNLLNEKYYETILKKLQINALSSIEIEFSKTEGEVRAKKLQHELEKMAENTLLKMKEFRFQIKGLKNSFENEENETLNKDLETIDRLSTLNEEIEIYLRSGIKKIKSE